MEANIIQSTVQTTDLNVSEGIITPFRLGKTRQMLTSLAEGEYMDMLRRGNVFVAVNTAAQALSLNSATATGLILSNPTGSGKNIFLLELCIAPATAPAGASTLIVTGSNVPANYAVTHTTPLTIRNAFLGGGNATSIAFADSAATIPASPTIFRAVGGGPVATGTTQAVFIRDQVNGALGMVPGTVISLQCLTTAISVVASMTWVEVPV
jgi:hypothetical protein